MFASPIHHEEQVPYFHPVNRRSNARLPLTKRFLRLQTSSDEASYDRSHSFLPSRQNGGLMKTNQLISSPVPSRVESDEDTDSGLVSPCSSFPSSEDGKELISQDKIRSADVLCGRGAGANTHAGNIAFRTLVAHYHQTYLNAKAIAKASIAKGIVLKIAENGGRFLKKFTVEGQDGDAGSVWYIIGDKTAGEKTCQALRERGPSVFDVAKERVTPREKKCSGTRTFKLPMLGQGTVAEISVNVESIVESPSQGIDMTKSISDALRSIEVTDNDVLLGRGGVTNSHVGNKRFRDLVHKYQPKYIAATKAEKSRISKCIVDEVESLGGRFLKYGKDGEWTEVEHTVAREKASQALRERAPALREVYEAAAGLASL